jgi:hypothetical protein
VENRQGKMRRDSCASRGRARGDARLQVEAPTERGDGRTVGAVLMLVGIGTIGMITGSTATYFVEVARDDVDADRAHP